MSLRSGSLIDPSGIIARALFSGVTVAAPLDSIYLRYICAVPANLSFALFNASLVAISTSDDIAMPPKTFSYITPEGDKKTFTCNCSGEYLELSPCLGLGIVKSIDLSSCSLALIVPERERFSLAKQESLTVLIRGSIQLPIIFIYDPSSPFLPYQTGELAGEGLNSMKARNNVKRKG